MTRNKEADPSLNAQFLFVAGILVMIAGMSSLTWISGYQVGIKAMQSEAVMQRAGAWVPDVNGRIKFAWKQEQTEASKE